MGPSGFLSRYFFLNIILFLFVLFFMVFPLTNLDLSLSSQNKSESEISEMIQTVLETRHPTDTADWWKSLGPLAPRVIISMFEKSDHIYHRVRLVQALAWFGDSESVEFLKKLSRETENGVIRNASIKSVGASQGDKEVPFVSGFLEHSDPQTRLSAAEALKRMNSELSNLKLSTYMSQEKQQWVTEKLKDKLKDDLPKASGLLKLVPISEDALHPDFVGEWEGYWIFPDLNKNLDVRSEKISVIFSWKTTQELEGNLKINKKNRKISFEIQNILGKKNKISGKLREVVTGGLRVFPSEVMLFDAELQEMKNGKVLKGKTLGLHALWLLRRKGP